MRILFLDFDGVLNSAKWFKESEHEREGVTNIYRRAELMLDPLAVQRLNKIVRATDCRIVVSSTWRIPYDLESLSIFLERRGFQGTGTLIDRTPVNRMKGNVRGHEIQEWLDHYPSSVETFCILDDDSDMAHLMDRLVKTTWDEGLQDEHVQQVIELLGPKTTKVNAGIETQPPAHVLRHQSS